MQYYIKLVNYGNMMQVYRDDIWFNVKQIKSSVKSIKNLSWNAGYIVGSFDEETRETEEDNYDKFKTIWKTIIPQYATSLQEDLAALLKIYNDKIVPYENKDDEFKKRQLNYIKPM